MGNGAARSVAGRGRRRHGAGARTRTGVRTAGGGRSISADGADGADGTGPRAPILRRRRPLPGGRAVVGGLLMAAAAVGLFAAYSRAADGPRHDYVVAIRALPPGTRLQASDLGLEPMDLPVALRSRAFDRRGVLAGATLISPLESGELVQASAVVAGTPEGARRELTFTVEQGHLAGGLKQGERVDVVATFGTGSDAVTDVVVRQALVVSLERPRSSLGEGSSSVVTVGLDGTADVLALAHASQLAKLTLIRATGAEPLPDTGGYRPATTGSGGGGTGGGPR